MNFYIMSKDIAVAKWQNNNLEIINEEMLLKQLTDLAQIKREYDSIKNALDAVRTTGYGIVSPTSEEMILDEPKIIKQGVRYGIKLKACAPSIHMMCNKPKCLKNA